MPHQILQPFLRNAILVAGDRRYTAKLTYRTLAAYRAAIKTLKGHHGGSLPDQVTGALHDGGPETTFVVTYDQARRTMYFAHETTP